MKDDKVRRKIEWENPIMKRHANSLRKKIADICIRDGIQRRVYGSLALLTAEAASSAYH